MRRHGPMTAHVAASRCSDWGEACCASTGETAYDGHAMTKIDWGRERARLEALYAGMSDGELQEVADDVDSLTEVARAALRAEMLRREMEAPAEAAPVAESGSAESQAPGPVIVGRYRDASTATIAKSLLDAAGIESFLADGVIQIDWLYSDALGGVKLLVRDEDAAAACELLEAQVPERFDVEGVGLYEQPKCPNCGSLDVYFRPPAKQGWNCSACGHRWPAPTENLRK